MGRFSGKDRADHERGLEGSSRILILKVAGVETWEGANAGRGPSTLTR